MDNIYYTQYSDNNTVTKYTVTPIIIIILDSLKQSFST